jgi:hypothetical protein
MAATAKDTPAPSSGYSSSSNIDGPEDTYWQEGPVFSTVSTAEGSADLMAWCPSPSSERETTIKGQWREQEMTLPQPAPPVLSPPQVGPCHAYPPLVFPIPHCVISHAQTVPGPALALPTHCCCGLHVPDLGTLGAQSAIEPGAEYGQTGLRLPNLEDIFTADPDNAQPASNLGIMGAQSAIEPGGEYGQAGLRLPNLDDIFTANLDTAHLAPYRKS